MYDVAFNILEGALSTPFYRYVFSTKIRCGVVCAQRNIHFELLVFQFLLQRYAVVCTDCVYQRERSSSGRLYCRHHLFYFSFSSPIPCIVVTLLIISLYFQASLLLAFILFNHPMYCRHPSISIYPS